jgi:MFS family permease
VNEAAAARPHGVADIVRVASGNFLEMYDFMVFGYFASAIGQTFFPGGDLTSLLKSLATFGAGYLMRPVGALLLGAYTDRHGRRAGLLLTLALMGIGIVVLTVTPGYAAIGVAAPLLVLAGRLVQGFSAGAELGNVSVYLAEIAPPAHRGFYVSWQSASQQVAVIAAALIGVALTALLPPASLAAWGWRIPLALGCLLLPLLVVLRRHLRESEAFERRAHTLSVGAIAAELWRARASVVLGMMLVTMTTVSFYTITAYTPTFGMLLHLPERGNLWVTAAVGVSNLAWLPAMGALSDRIGRRPILLATTALAILTAYPAMAWLVAAPSIARLAAVLLWLSALYGSYNGAVVVYLTEVMPQSVSAAAFSLAYSLATAAGGFSPLIVTWLSDRTRDPAIVGAWLSGAAALGLAATLILGRRERARRLA